ncbi:contact-dependent growth inhibition system immunity protein [Streptomyces sp. CSDS2]|uniref:contact-dependent growth inhibition system immunity protein n=1 Tax=Streptomyces sp. CSDS2 TaxID=3055051 RepID=UPI00339D9812
MLSDFVDRNSSIEELESHRWSAPQGDSTTLVHSVYELRKRAIADLTVEELRRLIAQDIGLH